MQLNLIDSFREFKDFKNFDKETMMAILEDVFRNMIINTICLFILLFNITKINCTIDHEVVLKWYLQLPMGRGNNQQSIRRKLMRQRNRGF